MPGTDPTPAWLSAAHAPNDAPPDRPAPGAVDLDYTVHILRWLVTAMSEGLDLTPAERAHVTEAARQAMRALASARPQDAGRELYDRLIELRALTPGAFAQIGIDAPLCDYARSVALPDPTWDDQCAAFEAAEDAHADEMAAVIAEQEGAEAPPDGPHFCVACHCEIAYPGLCEECGCEEDGDV